MKVILNGENFDYDGASAPMSEAMAVERESGRSYAEYMSALQAGALWAFCVLAWIIWRRDGRNVPLQDILDNKVDFDLGELLVSFMDGMGAEAQAAGEDPTGAGAVPAGTPGTRGGMRASSRKSSASGRGRSGG